MLDLDTLLARLTDDHGPTIGVDADLETAVDHMLDRLEQDGMPWTHDYRALATTSLFLRHFPDQHRRSYEIHFWRLAHLLGLKGARGPASIQLDLTKPFTLREATLLWTRFTLDERPWSHFDLRPLRATFTPPIDPIARALWRLATRSGVSRLAPRHRQAIHEIESEPTAWIRLVLEEARQIADETDQVDGLRLIADLLQDPILQYRDAEAALSLMGRTYLYFAHSHRRLGEVDAAAHCIRHWRALDSHIPIKAEQRLLASDIMARIEIDSGELVIAGDRLARSVMSASQEGELPIDQRAQIFATLGHHLAHSRFFDDAIGMLAKVLRWLDEVPDSGSDELRLTTVEEIASARWARFIAETRPYLFATDPVPDAALDLIASHRHDLCATRGDLEGVAAAWLDAGQGLDDAEHLIHYRWLMARALAIDEPHLAVDRLVSVGLALLGRSPVTTIVQVARDLVFPLRLAGLRLDQLVDAEPLACLYAVVPAARDAVQALVFSDELPSDEADRLLVMVH